MAIILRHSIVILSILIFSGMYCITGCSTKAPQNLGLTEQKPADKRIDAATAKAWSLATTAILTERNKQRHDLLGGTDLTEANAIHWKKILSDWWDVNNRQDLLASLTWIEQGGHRKEFDRLGRYLDTISDQQIGEILRQPTLDEENTNRVVIAKRYFEKLGKKSILGWDYARFISLCRWGYLVGYLTEEEAWSRIMPAARLLQKTFDSWKDLGENYLIGREFWSYEQSKKNGQLFRAAYSKLLNDTNSPWNRLNWNVYLLAP